MRRLAIALIILFFLVFICAWSYLEFVDIATTLSTQIEVVDSIIINDTDNMNEKAIENFDIAYNIWRNKQLVLGAIITHERLEEIENVFIKTQQSLHDGQTELYHIYSSELVSLIEHIPKSEKPNFQNIF